MVARRLRELVLGLLALGVFVGVVPLACTSEVVGTAPTDAGAAAADGGSSGPGLGNPDGGGVDPGPTACNALVELGSKLTASVVVGDAPTPTGGTIADGTYVLTSLTLYTDSGAVTANKATISLTVKIVGKTMQQVGTVNGEQHRFTTKLDVLGTDLQFTDTCPAPNVETHSFSATANEVHILDDTPNGVVVQVYTRS